jgi:hypothetical protein
MPIHGLKRVPESFSGKKRSSSADESGNAEWLTLIRHRESLAPADQESTNTGVQDGWTMIRHIEAM